MNRLDRRDQSNSAGNTPGQSRPISDRGSLWHGFKEGFRAFLIGLIVILLSITLLTFVAVSLPDTAYTIALWAINCSPILLMARAAILLVRSGRTRSATGVGLALVTVGALWLMMIAACFGLISKPGTL